MCGKRGGVNLKKLTGLLVFLLFGMMLTGASGQGSWEQINQELKRPEDWKQIVIGSAFHLGDKVEIGSSGGQALYEIKFGTYPSIDGSTVSVPMVMEFARQHLLLPEEEVKGFAFLSTTHTAYVHLILREPNGSAMLSSQSAAMDENHPVDIIIATEPSDEELALAAQNNITLVKKPVCYDAFVFITHKNNPVSNLTVEQIQKIYTGEITNWRDVGGPDESILAYQREKNSGSQTAMENLVMKGLPLYAAQPNFVTGDMEGLVRRVGDYANGMGSIGYTYKFYIDTLYKSDDIKVLSISGLAPEPENLRSGTYPFTTSYYGVIRAGEEQKAGGLFLDWMLSEEGQKCIAQAGYIPVMELPLQ
jgi:phosphate transport system substrate-binding protein